MKKFNTSNSAYELCKALGCLNALGDELEDFNDCLNSRADGSDTVVSLEAKAGLDTWQTLAMTACDIVSEQIDELDRAPESGDHNDTKHA